jgi:hypothetical protein
MFPPAFSVQGAVHRSPKIASGTNTDMPPEMPSPLLHGALFVLLQCNNETFSQLHQPRSGNGKRRMVSAADMAAGKPHDLYRTPP